MCEETGPETSHTNALSATKSLYCETQDDAAVIETEVDTDEMAQDGDGAVNAGDRT